MKATLYHQSATGGFSRQNSSHQRKNVVAVAPLRLKIRRRVILSRAKIPRGSVVFLTLFTEEFTAAGPHASIYIFHKFIFFSCLKP